MGDYVQERDGKLLRYTEYQTRAANPVGQGQGPTRQTEDQTGPAQPSTGNDEDAPNGSTKLDDSSSPAADGPPSPSSDEEEPTRILRPYETPLDNRFFVVERPKRFFCIGRIFKTVWFEPGNQHSTADPDVDWPAACPPFHDQKPFAKFRWFVVVRKRLHHSLCFAITTFGGRGATKASRGRPRDFVVLYPHSIEPPEPWPEEGIERDPLGVIIEEGQQYLSPSARIDCGRIYTVEDNLKVMKIGRIHPTSVPLLEQYFQESVQ